MKTKTVFIANAIALVTAVPPALAGATSIDGPVALPSALRLVGALLAVVGLVYASALGLRRLSARRAVAGRRTMKVVEVLPLGTRSRLVAVDLGETVVVVGAGDSAVSRVAEMPREAFVGLREHAEAPVIPFRDRLRKLAGK